VSIDHASGKIAVKLVQKGIEAEIAALDGVAFRQRADGEMFVNFASVLDLPVNSANASLLDISTNTKVSSIKSDAAVEKHLVLGHRAYSNGRSIEPLSPRYVGRNSGAPR
jgi:hypothetical protein